MLFYLAADALCLGLMATALCMSFFPSGLIRIALLTILFPLLSLGLCAWMTVFGFYLRLEDIARYDKILLWNFSLFLKIQAKPHIPNSF